MVKKFKGKRVAILGLSVEGIDSVKFFADQEAAILCCDMRSRQKMGETYSQLARYNVKFQLGSNYLNNLADCDIIVRTPGMNLATAQLVKLRQQGREITSLTKLFFELCPCPIIGVTGTKGKGTTSTLIYHMLKAQGRRAWLGGNVGTPLLSRVAGFKKTDWVVLELSSFQLEDLTRSPQIAVILKITQDHLANFDRLSTNYHPTRSDYVEAKRSVVSYQKASDWAIVNADDETSSFLGQQALAKVLRFSRIQDTADAYVRNHTVYLKAGAKTEKIVSSDEIMLRGDHNLENIAAACLASLAAGVSAASMKRAAREFRGLEHRLEFVRTVNGVSFYNDSFSTVPETAVAAIESFSEPIILIAGGSEKKSDFTVLGEVIAKSTVKVLIAIGQMTDRIEAAARGAEFKGELVTGYTSMPEIISAAVTRAVPGDVVLLSPAAASFDMFANYKDRGQQFKHEVLAL